MRNSLSAAFRNWWGIPVAVQTGRVEEGYGSRWVAGNQNRRRGVTAAAVRVKRTSRFLASSPRCERLRTLGMTIDTDRNTAGTGLQRPRPSSWSRRRDRGDRRRIRKDLPQVRSWTSPLLKRQTPRVAARAFSRGTWGTRLFPCHTRGLRSGAGIPCRCIRRWAW
jgi:hypothetical protein